MIAEAIHQTYPALTHIVADLQAIRVTDPEKRIRFVWMTPRPAQLALIDFDDGKQPAPFEFKLTRPSTITRSPAGARRGQVPRTKDQRRDADAERHRNTRAVADAIRAPNMDEPFFPPAEYARQVVAAMDDPNANLGPAVMLSPPESNRDSASPIQVGGNPPRRTHGPHGNIIQTRMFGLRELVK